MDENNPAAEEHHHRSARERQRRGPMWGCLRWLIIGILGLLLILFIITGGGWFYLGTSNFHDLVRLRVQKTLESRLGRSVSIGSVDIDRVHLSKVILNDLRIANSPGAVNPYF